MKGAEEGGHSVLCILSLSHSSSGECFVAALGVRAAARPSSALLTVAVIKEARGHNSRACL